MASSWRAIRNIVSRCRQLFEGLCGYSHVRWPFLSACNKDIEGVEIAIGLCRVVMHVLVDQPPSIPQKRAPLVSVFTSRELKPKWEARPLQRSRVKHAELRARREGSEESSEGYNDWESFEEEESAA